MNYTTNYHLPQWVKSDRIMMDDFNQMNGSIEAGMTETAAEAAAAAATANAAQALAQQTAGSAYSPANKPYVVGVYTGTGEVQEVILGFTPSVVMAFRMYDSNSEEGTLSQFCVSGRNVSPGKMRIIENGFRLGVEDYKYKFPAVNGKGFTYQYIAFK